MHALSGCRGGRLPGITTGTHNQKREKHMNTQTTAYKQGYSDAVRGYGYTPPELYNIRQRRAYWHGYTRGSGYARRVAAVLTRAA